MLDRLIFKYHDKGLLIDTNLLLVYLIGLYDPSYLLEFDKTDTYSEEDFSILKRFISNFGKILTTPNILTEISNFSLHVHNRKLEDYFCRLIEEISKYREIYLSKDELILCANLHRFGFTDVSILEIGKKENCLIITDDFKLCSYLQQNNLETLNFNYVRTSSWLN